MTQNTKYYASAVSNPDMPGTFWACFGIPDRGSQWVLDRGSRQVFTKSEDAEIAAFRIMCACLNRASGAQEFHTKRTDKGRIRGYRADDVGKGHGPIKDKHLEASVVFANFKKNGV